MATPHLKAPNAGKPESFLFVDRYRDYPSQTQWVVERVSINPTMFKRLLPSLLLATIGFATAFSAETTTVTPRFSDFPAGAYGGKLYIPSYYAKSDDMWRDDMGKAVAPPKVNFAGKYYIGLHSCGTECRYYTMSDLSTGNDSKALDMFSSDGEKPQKTSDGRTYVTELLSRPDSKMVVAEYHIDQSANKPEECRERIFLLSDDEK